MDEHMERQELYCHACGRYVQFPIDLSMNGRHVLRCPNCGHEHCRVVVDGRITDERWAQRNGYGNLPVYQINTRVITSSTSSASDNNWRAYGSWGSSTASTGDTYTWTGA